MKTQKKIIRQLLFWTLFVLVVIAAYACWWHYQHTRDAYVETHKLMDGSGLLVANPRGQAEALGMIVATAEQRLDEEALLTLSKLTGARLVQFELKVDGSCSDQQSRFDAARDVLGSTPNMVIGMDSGAAFSYRWLAQQQNDTAKALSIGFNINELDCSEALPSEALHGRWEVVWNNDPEDDTGLFIRQMEHTQVHTTIGEYGASSIALLTNSLALLTGAQTQGYPVIEIPSGVDGPYADTVTLFYSGDGGWRDLDKVSGEYMAAHGYSVVGIDSLKLFWQHRTAEQSAQDLAILMQTYRQKWGTQRFILAGYSFGADIMPALYNRLSPSDQASIGAVILIAFSRNANFEISVSGWLGAQSSEVLTAPEMQRVDSHKVVCIYGTEEQADSGCTEPGAVGELIRLPGGHHFDKDYEHLARILIQSINSRMPPRTQTRLTCRNFSSTQREKLLLHNE